MYQVGRRLEEDEWAKIEGLPAMYDVGIRRIRVPFTKALERWERSAENRARLLDELGGK